MEDQAPRGRDGARIQDEQVPVGVVPVDLEVKVVRVPYLGDAVRHGLVTVAVERGFAARRGQHDQSRPGQGDEGPGRASQFSGSGGETAMRTQSLRYGANDHVVHGGHTLPAMTGQRSTITRRPRTTQAGSAQRDLFDSLGAVLPRTWW